MIDICTNVREIAQGGQKTVYLATHPEIGQVVIKKGVIKSFISLERIKREIDILSNLDSGYYPKQYHFSIDVIAKSFEIVEAFIEGSPLRQCMHQFREPPSIFKLIWELSEGLSVIWEKNIVHRDLKPENIIIRPNGKPCIIDLGIARFIEMDSLTQTLAPLGPCTPIYASPEQLSNQKHLIDIRSDFFAIGIIALELYLGIHPFDPTVVKNQYSIVENIMQNLYKTSFDNITENEDLNAFSRKTLQVQPYMRFRNADALKSFLDQHT
jgi:serine/threonine protein kinase